MTDYNPFSLEGKTVLVTGASSGIGRATAIACSKMGAAVILTARNEERLLETKQLINKECTIYPADLTSEQDLEKLISQLPEIDGVVLCAGQTQTIPVKFAKREKFTSPFEINFFALVELNRLLFSKKKLKKDASVVIISSIGGLRIFNSGNMIYGTSKAALDSYMKYAAREFSTRSIRVNSICPGMVETPLIHAGVYTEEQLEEDVKRYPLGRFGKPEDIANAVIYLLSDASSWVTGHGLVIDGGVTI